MPSHPPVTLPSAMLPEGESIAFLARLKRQASKDFKWSRPTSITATVRLAFWLWVVARVDEALALCEFINRHSAAPGEELTYEIECLLALEARLWREAGQPQRHAELAARIEQGGFDRKRLQGDLLETDLDRTCRSDPEWAPDLRLSEAMEQVFITEMGGSTKLPASQVEALLQANVRQLQQFVPRVTAAPARSDAPHGGERSRPAEPLAIELPPAFDAAGETHTVLARARQKASKNFNWKRKNSLVDASLLALWLYALGRTQECRQVCEFLETWQFDGDFSRWSPVECCLGLLSRLLREQGDAQEARARAERILENRFVEARLDGDLLEAPRDSAEDALRGNDRTRERGWRLTLLSELVVVIEVGRLRERPVARLEEEFQATVARLQVLAG